ncbi:hypothetical protein BLA29_004684 [Euroglyphus maynei]|uniref:Uncharacterized protein n=1 Tax=Euroglyphus maynei TaxID=6958 RepID=A0A1Y3BBS2_EURMA|nr:hypothetical protein BLA29_004684 [Euroglyphus maynei]
MKLMLQKLILSGQLPCSKEEAVTLAVIQLRIDETSPPSNKTTLIDNESDHHNHHPHEGIIGQSSSSMLNKSTSLLDEKSLRPISENTDKRRKTKKSET